MFVLFVMKLCWPILNTERINNLFLFFLTFSRPKAKQVHLVAVGIGEYEKFQGQLEEIAGKNVYNASNFDELSDLVDDILAETCSK